MLNEILVAEVIEKIRTSKISSNIESKYLT